MEVKISTIKKQKNGTCDKDNGKFAAKIVIPCVWQELSEEEDGGDDD